MDTDDARALLHSAITYDEELPDGVIDRLGGTAVYRLMTAAVAAAVARRFPPGTPVTEVKEFAAGLPKRFPEGAELVRPQVAEDVILAMTGENDRVEGHDFTEVTGMLFILAYAIMSQENLDEEGFDAYFARVRALAEEDG